MYRYKDTCINVCSPNFKSVLRHSPFFFKHFGGIFESIGGSVSKIQPKTFVLLFWNWCYGIHWFFLALYIFFASIGGTVAKILAKTCIWRLLKPFYGICCSCFTTLVGFFVHWRYRCQYMRINVYSLALKPVSQNRRSFFSTLEVILRLSKVLLPKYGWKRVFGGFKTRFTAFAFFFSTLDVFLCLS